MVSIERVMQRLEKQRFPKTVQGIKVGDYLGNRKCIPHFCDPLIGLTNMSGRLGEQEKLLKNMRLTTVFWSSPKLLAIKECCHSTVKFR